MGGGLVELVGFVEVGGVLGGRQVERGFAGQGPGFEVGGVEEVGAPGSAVAGSQEGDGCCVGPGGAGAEVGQDG